MSIECVSDLGMEWSRDWYCRIERIDFCIVVWNEKANVWSSLFCNVYNLELEMSNQ